jgi:Putative 2OG-Fe(II) oxygenase
MCQTKTIDQVMQQFQFNPEVIVCFPTTVYKFNKPEFLIDARKVCNEKLDKARENQSVNELYPVVMSGNLIDDQIGYMIQFILDMGWSILESQGYDMKQYNTTFTEIWCQEHYKHSAMEQHVHGGGVQLIGFYFIDCPEYCSKVVFHDTRSAKVQINLPEHDNTNYTFASNLLNFNPTEGLLMFTNSWLPHSFTRHGSDAPMRFIHFNISVKPKQVCAVSDAEVI